MNDSFKEDISVHLIITHKCNLQCIYCYETRKTDKAMRIETAKEILAEYLNNSKKFSFVNIVLFGGEPFLYFQIVREICEWVWSNEWEVKYIFNFSTNGTLLNNESKEWLKENNIPEATFYIWQKRFRNEIATDLLIENAQEKVRNELVASNPIKEVEFVELKPSAFSPTPRSFGAVLKFNHASIEIKDDISEELLSKIFMVIAHVE